MRAKGLRLPDLVYLYAASMYYFRASRSGSEAAMTSSFLKLA